MAIINMIANNATDFPEGAVCPIHNYNSTSDRARGAFSVVTYPSHVGLCIEKRERNFYDDSDFYMVTWNPETGKAENITYASTRGWSYPCYGSDVDATPEVLAAYRAACDASMRRVRVQAKWDARRAERALAAKIGAPRSNVQRLRNAVGRDWTAVERLLTANIRSAFKKSLRDQIIAWTRDASPKFAAPLSNKQMQYL